MYSKINIKIILITIL